MNKRATILTQKQPTQFNCKSPLLFSIPKGIYEDELQRSSEKPWMKKILILQKKSEALKNEMESRSTHYLEMIAKTRALADRTRQINSYVRANVLTNRR